MAQAPSNPIYIGLEAQAAIQSSNKSLLSNNVQLGWKATDRLVFMQHQKVWYF